MALAKFPRVYTIADFGINIAGADIVIQPAQWSTIGTVTVPAAQQIAYGIGGLGSTDSREVCYLRIDAAGGQLQGRIRFVVSDPNQVRSIVVAEQRTERLSASQNDKQIGFLLGEYPIRAKEDSLLLVQYWPDGAVAVTIDVSDADNIWLVPVTVYQ
jgi:hypothetical protein